MHFCVLYRNSRWLLKVAGKRFFRKVVSRLCRYPACPKFHQNRSISHHFKDKCPFCILYRNSRWPLKVAGKQFLRNVASRLCKYPASQTFRQNRSLSHRFEINTLLHFTQKFKVTAKSSGKAIFA